MTETREPTPDRNYSIGELADAAGVSRRTVRFYVQRELIDPPEGRGRGAVYSERHREQIDKIRRLQREGLDLQTIRALPEDAMPAPSTTAEPAVVVRIPLGRGVRLEVDAAAGTLPDRAVLDELAAACARVLRDRSDPASSSTP